MYEPVSFKLSLFNCFFKLNHSHHLDDRKWQLIHDLWPVSQVIVAETLVVPDPHMLLSNIPEGGIWG